MSAEACRAALDGADILERAGQLDAAFPQCACEPWSLTADGGCGVQNEELVARVLVAPDDYDETASTILTSRLTALYSMGLSVIRQGASDDEVLGTIDELMTKGSERRTLVGAVVMGAEKIRSYANDDSRWFGVYATDDRGKERHADIFGTTPLGSNSSAKRTKSQRRNRLAADMLPLILFEADPPQLLSKLRLAGI